MNSTRRKFLRGFALSAGGIFVPRIVRGQIGPGLPFFGGKAAPGNGLLNGLLGYWTMDEAASATTRADATGNGWTGTRVGTTGSPNPGLIGNCLNNSGNECCIDVSGNIDNRASTTPFTFQAWVRWDGSDRTGTVVYGAYPNWYMTYFAGGANFRFHSETDAGVASFLTGSNVTFTTGNWYHVVFVWDGTNRTLYTNNVAVVDAGGANPPNISRNSARAADLQIGDLNPPSQLPLVSLDECAYWNRALSSGDVNTLNNNGAGYAFSNFTP